MSPRPALAAAPSDVACVLRRDDARRRAGWHAFVLPRKRRSTSEARRAPRPRALYQDGLQSYRAGNYDEAHCEAEGLVPAGPGRRAPL